MDTIRKIGNSLIQYGKESDRVYIMKLDPKDLPLVTEEISHLVKKEKYTKVFAKAPEEVLKYFKKQGFLTEAVVPGLYGEKGSGYFLARYFSEERKVDRYKEHCQKVLEVALSKKTKEDYILSANILSKSYELRRLNSVDVSDAAALYQKVFQTYPFPIHEESYLLETMENNLIYFGIWRESQLVALSSIEADKDNRNAEMTDFAILEECRGKGFAQLLLSHMENCLYDMGYHTAYTIARANSYGMNITFAKNNYIYAGTLLNNTQIGGDIESMNVWYKRIDTQNLNL